MTELEHDKLTALDERSKSNAKRLDSLEKRVTENEELVTSVALLAQKQESIEGDVKEIKSTVKSLAEKPGKRWDAVIDKALLAVVGAIVLYMIAKLGF
jgi:hypothetical protein